MGNCVCYISGHPLIKFPVNRPGGLKVADFKVINCDGKGRVRRWLRRVINFYAAEIETNSEKSDP